MQGSPWFHFSGAFGTLRSSLVIEASLSRQWNNRWWAQAGMQQTSTEFDRQLITNITPIYSMYAVGGWQQQGWSVYGGVQPTIVSGAMDLRLPVSVSQDGTMKYQDHRIDIRNRAVSFVGAEKSWKTRSYSFALGVVTNSESNHSFRANYKYSF
jgi:hypothetical protein